MDINIRGTTTGRFRSTELNESNTPKPGYLPEPRPGDRHFDWVADAVAGVPFDRDFDAARAQAASSSFDKAS